MITELALEALHLAVLAQSSVPRSEIKLPRNGTDPTEIRTRIEVTYDRQDRQGDDFAEVTTARVDVALSEQFLLRAVLPYANLENGGTADVDVKGIGDTTLGLGWRVVGEEDFAVYFGANMIFDTADDDELGQGRTQFAPEIATAFAITEFESAIYPVYQHFLSVGGEDGRGVNTSQFRTTVVTRWGQRVWTAFDPKFFVDWEARAHTGMTTDIELGAMLNKRVGVWVRPGAGLFGDDIEGVYDWHIGFGVRFLF